jgi:hypothetical protein
MLHGPPALKALGAALLALLGAAASLPALDGSKPEKPLPPTPLPSTRVHEESKIPVPSAWKHQSDGDVKAHHVELGRADRDRIQRAIRASAHKTVQCAGRDGTGKTAGAQVVKVERIENHPLWRQYWHRKRELVDTHHQNNVKVRPLQPPVRPLLADPDGLLDANLNEVYLMHGTSDWVIRDIIARTGFDERVANLRGLYGGGVYFACESCKSAQYAPVENGLKMLVISRVVLGDPYYATAAMQNERRPPLRGGAFAPGLTFDSVVANMLHREFIVYDHKQAYPEYIVWFREG